VVCRFFHDAQLPEVWDRGVQRASLIAVSLGHSHVQWLSAERRADTATYTTPVDCNRNYFSASYTCVGGNPFSVTVAWIMTTRFVFLSADEAAARINDPLIPPERRPIAARERAAAAAGMPATPASPPPASTSRPHPASGWHPE
jgi:hypothetical protein